MEKNIIQHHLQEIESLSKSASSKEELLFLLGAKEALTPFRYILNLQYNLDKLSKSTREGLDTLGAFTFMNMSKIEKLLEHLSRPAPGKAQIWNHYQKHWLGGRR